jgi:hypothetical protein
MLIYGGGHCGFKEAVDLALSAISDVALGFKKGHAPSDL